MNKAIRGILLTLLASTVVAPASHAQFGDLGGMLGKLAAPSLSKMIGGQDPVSTNVRDARYGDPDRDGFTPPGQVRRLEALERTAEGGFVLAAGYYQMTDQSYCLHAGTYGPGGGDGYLYGPLAGSARDAVTSILQNSVSHPQIAQHDIQLLLWAIVARAKFEDLNTELKLVASQLLTPRQITSLNRSALGMLTSPQLARLGIGMPPYLQQILAAEARMRDLLAGPSTSYAEMERLAVLTGAVPRGPGSIDVPASRWSRHPAGYWIRFIPSGYSQTLVQIWVEPSSEAIGQIYDPALVVAVPANTARQRLAQSGRTFGA